MEPKAGLTLSQMWINAEADITQKTSRSNEIRDSDLRRVASAVTSLPAPQMADSPFLKALGTPTIRFYMDFNLLFINSIYIYIYKHLNTYKYIYIQVYFKLNLQKKNA